MAGVPPLVWNAALAADARAYAETMTRTGRFAHAEQPQGPAREGENLWTGTRGAYRYCEMVASWIAERCHFKNGVTPDFSTTGDYRDTPRSSGAAASGRLRAGEQPHPRPLPAREGADLS